MRVVIAVDSFKGTLSSAAAAGHLAEGLRESGASVMTVPVADGGEGTVDAAVAAGFRPVEVSVTGPTGVAHHTTLALRDDVAVVELAASGGLPALPGGVLAPMTASTVGVGEAVLAALDHDVHRVILGLGGSASTDAGAGMLTALGARLRDTAGSPIAPGGAGLHDVATVDLVPARERLREIDLVLACDVDNPLTGPDGAAAVYAPQKGATPEQVRDLDAALVRFARCVEGGSPSVAAQPGAGAAGGTGYAGLLLGGRVLPGIETMLSLAGLDAAMRGADLVITGEGSLDAQSLYGKAPVGVARAAARHGVPLVAVAGRVELDPARLHQAGFDRAYALTDLAPPAQCLAAPGPLLQRIGARIADESPTRGAR